MSPDCVLGIDVGTTSTRAGLYSSSGELLGEGRASYQTQHRRLGWSEQAADDWWSATTDAVRQAMETSVGAGRTRVVPTRHVLGLALTHQRTSFVAVDRDLRPMRLAILWNDTRGVEQGERVAQRLGNQTVYARTGFAPGLGSLYKVLWIKDHEPEIWRRVHKFLLVADYLIYRLTGRVATAQGTASETGCLDIAHPTRWATDVLEACGVDVGLWPEEILPAGEVVGGLTPAAAAALGLPAGLPVVMAAGDQNCGTLGVGVVRQGLAGINGGTSCSVQMLAEALPIDPQRRYYIEISPLGAYLPETFLRTGATLLTWYRDQYAQPERAAAEEAGLEVWDLIYEMIDQTPAGNLGLMVLPNFAGMGPPEWDLRARGVAFGLRLEHTRAHLARALVEGQAYECRRLIEAMQAGTGIELQEVAYYGGSTRSPIWVQTFVDVLNLPGYTTDSVETTALGAAICAAAGVGLYPDVRSAATGMVRGRKAFTPNPERAALYDQLYTQVYRELYDRLKDLFPRLYALSQSMD